MSDYLTQDKTSAEYRREVLSRPEMLTRKQFADRANLQSIAAIEDWHKGCSVIVLREGRITRMPAWQANYSVWHSLHEIGQSLGHVNGWALYDWMTTPHKALDGMTPRAALEAGKWQLVVRAALADGSE